MTTTITATLGSPLSSVQFLNGFRMCNFFKLDSKWKKRQMVCRRVGRTNKVRNRFILLLVREKRGTRCIQNCRHQQGAHKIHNTWHMKENNRNFFAPKQSVDHLVLHEYFDTCNSYNLCNPNIWVTIPPQNALTFVVFFVVRTSNVIDNVRLGNRTNEK